MPYVEPGYTAIDDFDGDLTANVVVAGDVVDTATVGTYIITYTVSDAQGKTTVATRTVNVIANAAPVVTLLGANPTTVIEGDAFTDPGATALDDNDGDLTASIVVSGTVDTNTPGTYSVSYSATDAQGLTSTATRTVNVVANAAPVITLAGANPLTIVQGS